MRAENVNRFLIDVIDRYAQSLLDGAPISINEESIRMRLLPI